MRLRLLAVISIVCLLFAPGGYAAGDTFRGQCGRDDIRR